MYFPSNTSTDWETISIASLGWNQSMIQPLKDCLIQKNTKSFMILVNGKIVMEEYFEGHAQNTSWGWNSAGKRMGDASDPANPNFAVSGFDNEIWAKINAVIN